MEELIHQRDEAELEKLIDSFSGIESDAKIEIKQGLLKIRKASVVITDALKELYDHSCQICGTNPSVGLQREYSGGTSY